MSRPAQEDKNLAAFGRIAANLRLKKGLTQQQLAEKTGLSIDTVAAIENGRRWARLTTLRKLAKGLGVRSKDLFEGL
jgi:transcriptional regulator with XRE-family HTH domain